MKINKQIRHKEIKLIDENSSMLGLFSSKDAQKIANERNLDLVEISSNTNPPICKLMDYGKYRYEMDKKEKENKKINNVLKEIGFHMNTSENDLRNKIKQAKSFVEKFSKVQVNLILKKYEVEQKARALEKMLNIIDMMKEFAKPNIEKPAINGKIVKLTFNKI